MMGATYREKNRHSWIVTVHQGGLREFKAVKSKQDAKDLIQYIHKQEPAGVNVVETIRQARAKAHEPALAVVAHPTLQAALPDWIDRQARAREFRESTAEI